MKVKKLLSTFAALAIAASSFAAWGINASAAATEIFKEDFQAKTAGDATDWKFDSIGANGTRTYVKAADSDNIYFSNSVGAKNNAARIARYSLIPSEGTATALNDGNVTVSFKAMIDKIADDTSASTAGADYTLVDESGNVIISVAFTDVGISYYTGGAASNADNTANGNWGTNANFSVENKVDDITLANNTWYDVTISINPVANTAKLTVGDKTVENIQVVVSSALKAIQINAGRLASTGAALSSTAATGYIDDIVISKEAIVAEKANYTVKYLLKEAETETAVKEAETIEGYVNSAVVLEKSVEDSFYSTDKTKKYIYVENDSANKTIAQDGSTVINVYYREAETYSYTANAVIGEATEKQLGTGTAFEGDSVSVPFPLYILKDGALYSTTKNNSNAHYGRTFIPAKDSHVENIAYTNANIDNVVYYSEGEDIEGLTKLNQNNVNVRSSQCGAAYAASDVVLGKLEAGTYQVIGVVFSNTSSGKLDFTLGSNEFSFAVTAKSNWVDVKSDIMTIDTASDLIFKTSGDNNLGIDFIYVRKITDPVIMSAQVQATDAPDDTQALTGVGTADVTYADVKGEKVLTTVYIKVANAADGKAPKLTVGGQDYQATYEGIKANGGVYIYQILSDEAVDLTEYTVTYDGAADKVVAPKA